MIDLQEVFCSPACLLGVVFTAALVGDCMSCTGVSLRVCEFMCAAYCTFTSFIQFKRHSEFSLEVLKILEKRKISVEFLL